MSRRLRDPLARLQVKHDKNNHVHDRVLDAALLLHRTLPEAVHAHAVVLLQVLLEVRQQRLLAPVLVNEYTPAMFAFFSSLRCVMYSFDSPRSVASTLFAMVPAIWLLHRLVGNTTSPARDTRRLWVFSLIGVGLEG